MVTKMTRVLAGVAAMSLLAVPLAPASGQTFRYPEDTRPTSLLPFFAEDMSSVRIVELIFDSLIRINKRGDFEGGLATSWKADDDKMGIRLVLRDGVKWHDGKPFAADDVAFTVSAAQNPKTVFNAKAKFGFIASVEVEGPHAIRIVFDRPVSEPARRLMFKILPKHAFKGTAIKRNDKFSRRPVGTGPYQVKKGGYSVRSIALEANPEYWGSVKIPDIMMQHTPDKSAQVNLLQYSGGRAGVQAVIFLPPKNIPLFENSDSVVLEPYHTVSWWYLAFNHKNKALQDRAVREAIGLAIDRESLLEAHLGRGDILSGPFTESSPFYNFEVQVRTPDLERAKKLLKDAGYTMKGRNRRKGKTKLDFKFVMDKELASNQALFLGIQGQLKKIGISVRPQYVDHARYRDQVFGRQKYDMTVNVWSFEEVEDVYPLFHSSGVMNFIGYDNPDVDALLDTAKATHDYKKYKEYMKQLHSVLNEELPYLFMWSLDVYSGISKKVRNVFIQPYYYFTSFREWELGP